MSLEPNYLVLIAPGADANDPTPDWVDISGDLQAVDYGRGSPSDLDRNNPGTATVVLDNWSGDYDNNNSGSPYVGQLVPNMRLRILAEWYGDLYPQFDGYLDGLPLDYPGEGLALAELRATDGFKPLARTDLPESAYIAEVSGDGPTRWYRLDEPDSTTTVFDAGTGKADGTLIGAPTFGAAGIVSRDPGTAMATTGTDTGPVQGFKVDTILFGPAISGTGPFSIEFVVSCGVQSGSGGASIYYQSQAAGAAAGLIDVRILGGSAGAPGVVTLWTSLIPSVMVQSTVRVDDGSPHHVVASREAGGALKIYVDGVDRTSTPASSTDNINGSAMYVGSALGLILGLTGTLQHVAVYSSSALSTTRIAAHAGAVSTPWNDDSPGERAERILDLIGWPDNLRDLDDGASTLQSATLGTTALEHLQKVAESEFGEFFISADGVATLRARGNRINRAALAAFGDADSEIAYRTIRFDDSDELIRNPVTISRSEGVAQTVVDEANVARYYPNSYSLDGLYHDDDLLSRHAAEFYVSEFKDPKRRVTGLTFGPARDDRRFDLYPLLLEIGLGQFYDVTFRPPNADTFTQTVVIEGVRHSWTPEAGHSCQLDTSPAFTGTFLELDSLDGDGLGTDGSDGDRLFF